MRRILGTSVIALTAGLLAVSPAAAGATTTARGYQYKITFKGTGMLSLTDSDGQGPPSDESESGSWTMVPVQPVTMWVPKFNGPPGMPYSAMADQSDAANPAGTVTESGHYLDSPMGSPVQQPYSCQGGVEVSGFARFTIDVGPYDPTPSIQTDFVGQMQAGDPLTPSSCNTDPMRLYEPQTVDDFNVTWFPPGTAANQSASGEMLAVGTLIPLQDIGLASFSLGPAQDYNHVTDPGGCRWSNTGQNCRFKFQLGGEYEFTLVCAGTVSSGVGSCGGGSKGTGPGKGSGSGGSGSGGKNKECKVPKLKGKTLARAKGALKAANCAVGAVKHKKSSSVAKGKVISSSPGAGATQPSGAKVKLTVSKGK